MTPFIEVCVYTPTNHTELVNTLHIREVLSMAGAPVDHAIIEMCGGKTIFTQESFESIKDKITACFSGETNASKPSPL